MQTRVVGDMMLYQIDVLKHMVNVSMVAPQYASVKMERGRVKLQIPSEQMHSGLARKKSTTKQEPASNGSFLPKG
jgi:hypothetical protein